MNDKVLPHSNNMSTVYRTNRLSRRNLSSFQVISDQIKSRSMIFSQRFDNESSGFIVSSFKREPTVDQELMKMQSSVKENLANMLISKKPVDYQKQFNSRFNLNKLLKPDIVNVEEKHKYVGEMDNNAIQFVSNFPGSDSRTLSQYEVLSTAQDIERKAGLGPNATFEEVARKMTQFNKPKTEYVDVQSMFDETDLIQQCQELKDLPLNNVDLMRQSGVDVMRYEELKLQQACQDNQIIQTLKIQKNVLGQQEKSLKQEMDQSISILTRMSDKLRRFGRRPLNHAISFTHGGFDVNLSLSANLNSLKPVDAQERDDVTEQQQLSHVQAILASFQSGCYLEVVEKDSDVFMFAKVEINTYIKIIMKDIVIFSHPIESVVVMGNDHCMPEVRQKLGDLLNEEDRCFSFSMKGDAIYVVVNEFEYADYIQALNQLFTLCE